MSTQPSPPSANDAQFSTLEVARMLGMAVRSVQLMVDRGELDAWKTPGGHRRISADSVHRWMASRQGKGAGGSLVTPLAAPMAGSDSRPALPAAARKPCVLLIEDSKHYQNLVSLLMRQILPDVSLEVADDGIAGLAMAGQLQPDVLIVDILLPGIDGATLIMSLRSHPQFSHSRLIVITSLEEGDREPYRFALEGVPLVHKSRLVAELPGLLRHGLGLDAAMAPA